MRAGRESELYELGYFDPVNTYKGLVRVQNGCWRQVQWWTTDSCGRGGGFPAGTFGGEAEGLIEAGKEVMEHW